MGRTGSILILIMLLAGAIASGSAAFGTALIVCAALLLAYFFIDLGARKRISAEVNTLPVAGQNGRASVIAELRNRWVLPVFLSYRIRVRNRYTGEENVEKRMTAVPARGSVEVTPEVKTEYPGKISFSAENIRLVDPLGIIAVRTGAEASGSYTVLPDMFDVTAGSFLTESRSMDNDLYSSYRKGQDRSETFQIREYEEGDSISQIHWKLTGKTDKLIVKDPSLPLDKTIVVVVDKTSAETLAPDRAATLAELFVSVCQGLLESGLTYRLIWCEGDDVLRVEEIQFEDDLAAAIPGMLSSETGPGKSPLELYAGIIGQTEATHVIYIKAGGESMPEPEEVNEVFPGASLIPAASGPDQRDRLRAIFPEYI